MAFLRELGDTGLTVSALGLGTVKIGRDQGVKYPTPFSIPDDDAVRDLLARARELGINLIDTAPAYGRSEERLGQLLRDRQDWVIVSKVGEEFSDGDSHFDFSPAHTRASVERSLRRLNTDYLDCVLIHSDGNDLDVLRSGALETLEEMKQAGLIRAGEWWRTFTALGLHADPLHLAGNLIYGLIFGFLAGQLLGWGLAWSGLLLAGALGNLLNAFLQAPTHSSIGASTAVFATSTAPPKLKKPCSMPE